MGNLRGHKSSASFPLESGACYGLLSFILRRQVGGLVDAGLCQERHRPGSAARTPQPLGNGNCAFPALRGPHFPAGYPGLLGPATDPTLGGLTPFLSNPNSNEKLRCEQAWEAKWIFFVFCFCFNRVPHLNPQPIRSLCTLAPSCGLLWAAWGQGARGGAQKMTQNPPLPFNHQIANFLSASKMAGKRFHSMGDFCPPGGDRPASFPPI